MFKRWLLTLLVLLTVLLVHRFAPLPSEALTESVMLQVNPDNEALREAMWLAHTLPVRQITLVLAVIVLAALWLPVLLKRRYTAGVLVLLFLASCMPGQAIVTIDPNETAFLVPVTGNASEQEQVDRSSFENAEQISASQYLIPRQWIQNGGFLGLDGFWQPAVRVYKVNLTPVVDTWTGDRAVPVETSDSTGAGVPINITARLYEVDTVIPGTEITCQGANTYLANYGRNVGALTIETYEVEARPLSDVLNSEVRRTAEIIVGEMFDDVPAAQATERKGQIVADAKTQLQNRFAPEGICITDFGSTIGLIYDDPAYQQSLDQGVLREQNERAARADAQLTSVFARAAADATQIAVTSQAGVAQIEADALVSRSNAYATATVSAGNAAAVALQAQADVIQNNPALIQYEQAQRWDGNLPPNYGGGNGQGPQIYMMITPEPEE